MIDQFGFSKQICIYGSRESVWDISMPNASEEYERIVSDAIELSERELTSRLKFQNIDEFSSLQGTDFEANSVSAAEHLDSQLGSNEDSSQIGGKHAAQDQSSSDDLNGGTSSVQNISNLNVNARNFGSDSVEQSESPSSIIGDDTQPVTQDEKDETGDEKEVDRTVKSPKKSNISSFHFIFSSGKILKITTDVYEDILSVEDLVSKSLLWSKGEETTSLQSLLENSQHIRPKLVENMRTETLFLKAGEKQ